MSKPIAAFVATIKKDIDMRVFDELKRRVAGSDQVVKVGVQNGKKEKDTDTSVAMIAAVHEYGSPSQSIPERPFLRTAINKNREKYMRLNRINLVKILRDQMKTPQALGMLGAMAKSDVQAEIRSGDFTPLKPATVKRKGSSTPLIDTGQLVQSITWVLADKERE